MGSSAARPTGLPRRVAGGPRYARSALRTMVRGLLCKRLQGREQAVPPAQRPGGSYGHCPEQLPVAGGAFILNKRAVAICRGSSGLKSNLFSTRVGVRAPPLGIALLFLS